jgi:hypothetical protein
MLHAMLAMYVDHWFVTVCAAPQKVGQFLAVLVGLAFMALQVRSHSASHAAAPH